jgi:hypothetical protein
VVTQNQHRMTERIAQPSICHTVLNILEIEREICKRSSRVDKARKFI